MIEIILAFGALYLVFSINEKEKPRKRTKPLTNSAKAKSTTTNSGGLKNG